MIQCNNNQLKSNINFTLIIFHHKLFMCKVYDGKLREVLMILVELKCLKDLRMYVT